MSTTWATRPETAEDVSAIREVNLAAFPTPEDTDQAHADGQRDAGHCGVVSRAFSWAGVLPPAVGEPLFG
jgi:hypothetical protein